MRRRAALALLWGALWPPARAAAPPPPDRTILVMVRQPPDHARLGPDYGGGGYGDGVTRAALARVARAISARHGLTLAGDWPMPLLGVDCFIMVVPDGRSPDAEAAAVARERSVAWSQPMHVYQAQAGGRGDPLLAAQPTAALWHLAALHRIATGRGVSVAVIDSRIDLAHPDLAGRVSLARDFAEGHDGDAAERHGTAVAGVIAAVGDNGVGIVGVAPDAHLLGLRACWETAGRETLCDTLSLARALTFAIERRAQVINLSLSGPRDPLLGKLIDLGLGRGATIVAAVDPKVPDGGFPADRPGVLAVADGPVTRPGSTVYTAPGHDIPTTAPGGTWTLVNGTSFAAAQISGLVAVMRERGGAAAPRLLAQARQADGAIDGCALVRPGGSAGDPSCLPAAPTRTAAR